MTKNNDRTSTHSTFLEFRSFNSTNIINATTTSFTVENITNDGNEMIVPMEVDLLVEEENNEDEQGNNNNLPNHESQKPEITEEQKQHVLNTLYRNRNTRKTLALVDPYLFGGFRNQHLRFVGFVKYATLINATAILLDSIYWSGYKKGPRVKHELVFDVDYWNSISEQENLPRFVQYNPYLHPCWDGTINLFHAIDPEIVLHKYFAPRKYTFMDDIANCSKPYGFGSGGGAGRLWEQYRIMNEEMRASGESSEESRRLDPVELSVYKALRPSPKFQEVVDSFIRQHSSDQSSHESNDMQSSNGILAVHPRIEIDMMLHKCSANMVKNLTTLVDRMERSPLLNEHYDTTEGPSSRPIYQTVFIALSRYWLLKDAGEMASLAEENLSKFDSILSHGLWNGTVPVVESGEVNTEKVITEDSISLAGSVINFYIAVTADCFLGTYGSSYSVDVWTARYHLGKGSCNLFHDKDVVGRLPHGGLPKEHSRC